MSWTPSSPILTQGLLRPVHAVSAASTPAPLPTLPPPGRRVAPGRAHREGGHLLGDCQEGQGLEVVSWEAGLEWGEWGLRLG